MTEEKFCIRRGREGDIPAIVRLLYQVHKVHSDVRPDLSGTPRVVLAGRPNGGTGAVR